MRRVAICGFAAALVWLGSVAAAAQPVDKVLGGPGVQYNPSSDGVTMAYDQYKHQQESVWVMNLATRHRSRVTPAGTGSAMGSIIPGTDQLVYQEFSRRRSDLYFYDLVTKTRTKAPKAVDTADWEFWPQGSIDHLLFLRGVLARDGSFKRLMLVLYDRSTRQQRMLISDIPRGHRIFPGFVGSAYAAWTDCATGNTRCRVRYFDIATSSTHTLAAPRGLSDYAPVIDEAANQMYFVRSVSGTCGRDVGIRRVDLGSPVAAFIATLPRKVDTGWTMSLAPNTISMQQDLYFSRWDCKRKEGDIYAVRSADAP